jgi:hypothetical protein
MRRRSRAASNPVKSGGNHASKRKPRKAPTQRASAADPQEQIESLKRERDEALEQQTATSEILAVISKSLTDTQPAFDAIVQSGLRLFPNATVTVVLANAGMITAAAIAAPDSARVEAWRRTFPYPLTRQYMHGRAILDCELVDFPDVEKKLPLKRPPRDHDHAHDPR